MDEAQFLTRVREIGARLEAIESQLAVLSERAGVPYQRPLADEVPQHVRELAQAGKAIQAIQELRSARGLSLLEAKMIVDQL